MAVSARNSFWTTTCLSVAKETSNSKGSKISCPKFQNTPENATNMELKDWCFFLNVFSFSKGALF